MREVLRAPAKLNLCLYVGDRREDGLHEIRSLFCALSLADRLVVRDAAADEVACEAVAGPNLAGAALAALREAGWRGPPVRVEIEKRIPVAAGLGGGSADAAAVLRLARGEVEGLEAIAAELGADVTSQLDPGFALVGGAGERVEPLPAPGEFAAVVIPAEDGLRSGDVYAEADGLGRARGPADLGKLEGALRTAAAPGRSPLEYSELLVNDLTEAVLSLRPETADAMDALEAAGSPCVLVAGSGPSVVGLFEDLVAADAAAAGLPPRFAEALVVTPEVPG